MFCNFVFAQLCALVNLSLVGNTPQLLVLLLTLCCLYQRLYFYQYIFVLCSTEH